MSNAVATVAYLQGQAWAKAPDGSLRLLTPGAVLHDNETLVTAEGARVELDIGGVEALVINGGQEVAMSRDMNPQTATSADEALLNDASVQQVLAALEQDGDLLDELEETAAGDNSSSGGGSNSFVRLDRISESTDPLEFTYGQDGQPAPTLALYDGQPVSVSRDDEPVGPEVPVNNIPVSTDQTLTMDEDTQLNGQIVATDIDGDALTYIVSGNPANGTLTLNPVTGEFEYTPNANYHGSDSFVVTISDGKGGTTTSTVTINITDIDDVPVISTGSGAVVEDVTPSTSGTLTATDADNPGLAFVGSTQSGTYGSLVLQANGQWTYTLDSRADALAEGELQSESFTVTLTDGSTTTVTISITGTDDLPVISTSSGAVVEDVTPSTSGTLTATDADNPSLAFVGSTQSGTYGSLVLQANGQWTYTLDSRADALAEGELQSESFTVTLTDGSTTTVTISITGTDDLPVISTGSGAVVEDVTPSTSGTLTATDADNPGLAFVGSTQSGTYGSLVLQANGQWTYTLDSRADVLAEGELQSESFTVTLNDGSTTTVTISITGTDDLPVISTGSGAVVEDVTPSTSGTLTATDADNPGLAFVGSTQSGTYGSLVLQANGQWTYTLDSRADALAEGELQSESFTVTLNDGSTTTVTISITGTDDLPVISTGSGAVVEDVTPSTSGTLTATDADNPSLAFVGSTQSGTYGSLVLQANGQWTYTLDSRADALAEGELQSESFTVTLNDGSTTTVTISITGTDDLPVISTGSGAVVEDVTPSTSGTLTATDADNPSLAFVGSTQSGTYGSLVLQANGQWTYTLDSRADALAEGELQSESFTVTLNDGSTTTVTISITGTDDLPVISTGSGAVVEDVTPSTSGTLTATDADNPGLAFVGSTQSGTYGSLVLQANGQWTYTLDSRADALAEGELQSESFTVTLTDGSTTTVTISITGTDDLPVISTGSGAVVEDVTPSTSGTLTATDADNPGLAFVGSTQSGTYGSLVLQANGQWTYTLDSRADVLAEGELQSESFTVTLNDGSTTTVTISITGTDDLPVISTGSGAVVEDVTPSTSGTLTATDADNPGLAFVGSTQSGTYGSLVLQANGQWTYTLDSRADALAEGELQSESFTVTLNDGSTTTVTISITGTDDLPVISTGSGAVVEDVTPSTSGTLTATDADNPSLAFVGSTQSGTYGSLVLQADGQWTYTLDSRADALAEGELQSELFTVTLNDGSTTTVTISITGTNDAPTARADSGSTPRDTVLVFTAAELLANDSDPDNDTLTIESVQDAVNGSVTTNADGEVVFTPTPGYSGPASFTYTISDGQGGTSTATVNITVTPVNDAPIAIDDSPVNASTPQGLYAEYFAYRQGTDGPNLTNLTQVSAYANAHTASATFIAKTLDYNRANAFGDNLGKVSNLKTFLGSDAASLSNDPINASDAIIRMNGFIELNAGTYNFRVLGDDGYQIKIDGVTVAEVSKNQQATTTTHSSFTIATSGIHTIEIIYWDQGYYAMFAAEISDNAGASYKPFSAFNTYQSANFVAIEDTAYSIPVASLLANDTDANNDTLSIHSVGNATHGDVNIVGGNVVFTPAANYAGPASFTYTVTDGRGGFDTATVNLVVKPVNDAPVAVNDNLSLAADKTTTVKLTELLANDTDVDGDILEVISVQNPVNGTASLTANGVVFTPTAGFEGLASFEYTVSDPSGLTSTARVDLAVGSAIAPSVVVSKSLLAIAHGTGGTSVKFPITTKLVDTDGSETLSIKVSGVPTGLSFNAGINLGGGVWQFTEADLPNLTLNLPGSYTTNATNLTVQVTSTETSGGFTASTSTVVTLKAAYTTVDVTTTESGNYTGNAANEYIQGGAGDNTINGGSGNNIINGGAGNDKLSTGGGSDIIYGGSGDDIIHSGSGTDRIYGGAGNDTLTGGDAGENFVDVFVWNLGDQGAAGAPAVDTIHNFATASANTNGSGGDVLDLRDLLQGELVGAANSAGNLANYLHFEVSGGSTVIHISHMGGFFADSHTVGAGYNSGTETQKIVLSGVDLQSLYSGATTDQQIITQLLNNNKLITD